MCLFFVSANLHAIDCEIQAGDLDYLAQDPEWLALGHYLNDKSFVDSEEFFLAENGKYDPVAELHATANKFVTKPEYICKYPARYSFISSKIELDNCINNYPDCSEFSEWRKNIDAKSVTLIFPASFVNNPASAFGHTLIRLDQSADDPNTALYSYAVNFSAQTFGEPGLVYAFKGIFGGYNGYFSIAPYYKLVNKYSNLEKRDIWEYKLNYTQAEINRLVQHLWEIKKINFNYYYFDENCSYQLLGLFDVLRPGRNLRNDFDMWAIPSDTLKLLLEEEGLLLEEEFRPSLGSHFDAHQARLEKQDKALAKEIVEKKSLKRGTKPEVLDLAYDYLEYLILKDKIPKAESDPLAHQILSYRSGIDYQFRPVEVKPKANPLESHGSKRLSVNYGFFDQENFVEFEFRPAYHDLLDSNLGFLQGSAIDFMELSFRKLEAEDLKFQQLDLLEITSLSPKNYFIKPISWKFYTGSNRTDFQTEKQKLVYENKLYLGSSEKISNSIFYVLGGVVNQVGTHLSGNHSDGLGLNIGSINYLTEDLRLLFDLELNRYWISDIQTDLNLLLAFNYDLGPDTAFRIAYQLDKNDYSQINTFSSNLAYYF